MCVYSLTFEIKRAFQFIWKLKENNKYICFVEFSTKWNKTGKCVDTVVSLSVGRGTAGWKVKWVQKKKHLSLSHFTL